eukprot:1159373-Pelagomonas_calceolata.AAC.12
MGLGKATGSDVEHSTPLPFTMTRKIGIVGQLAGLKRANGWSTAHHHSLPRRPEEPLEHIMLGGSCKLYADGEVLELAIQLQISCLAHAFGSLLTQEPSSSCATAHTAEGVAAHQSVCVTKPWSASER